MLYSFKDIKKKGSENKNYMLTMKCDTHNDYKFVDDLFQFSGHLKNSEKYVKAIRQAKKHRQQVLPYSDSKQLIDAEDLNVIVSVKDYYNTVRKKISDKLKSKTIIALLRMLKNNDFIYRI